MTLTANWSRIAPSVPLHRSSLAVSVIGDRAFVFGGELTPRTPLDNHLYALDLTSQSRSYTVSVTYAARGD